MQIRLTVVDPLGPAPQQRGRAARRDVLVTAPAGTALAEVASALAAAVAGDAGGAHERGRESGGAVVLYAGAERLDGRRRTLGEPPLTDGAVLFLGAPGEPEAHPETDDAPTQLHVVAGPDAGGVHLLHGGRIRVGRSADAEVPLDDPDVSRLHCAITVEPDGRVSVADLGSTNGTLLDGTRVGPQAVRFPTGALLRLGESALRLAPAGGPGARAVTAPDGEGRFRLSAGTSAATPAAHPAGGTAAAAVTGGTDPAGGTRQAYGGAGRGIPGHGPGEPPAVPGQGHAPRIESAGGGVPGPLERADGERYGGATRTGGLPGPRAGGGYGLPAHDREPTADDRTARDRAPRSTPANPDSYGRTGAGDRPEDHATGPRAADPYGRDVTQANGTTHRQGRRTPDTHQGPYGRGTGPDDDPRTPGHGPAGRHPGQGTGDRPGTGNRTADTYSADAHAEDVTQANGTTHGQGRWTPDTDQGPYGRGTGSDDDPRTPGRGPAGRHPGQGTGDRPGTGNRTADTYSADAHAGDVAGANGTTHGQGRWTPTHQGPYGRGTGPDDDPRTPGHGPAGAHPASARGEDVTDEDRTTRVRRRRAPGEEVPPSDGRAPGADPRAHGLPGTGTHPGHPAATPPLPGTPPMPHHYDALHGDALHGDTGPYGGRPASDVDPHGRGRGTGGAQAEAGGLPVTRAAERPGARPAGRDSAGEGARPRAHGTPGGEAPQGSRVPGPNGVAVPAPDADALHSDADAPHPARRRGGLSAWARRLAGGRGAQPHDTDGAGAGADAAGDAVRAQQPESWPDPAALLLTALGPGPRLWERGAGHPEALTVRVGTADRTAPGGAGLLPAVPVTAALREAGALGLAGPRPRLAGLARSVLAQLTALHSPDVLEVVLLSTDRARTVEERTAEWSWLGWLPHLRPGRGQDCRLLLAFDREQAAARTDELLRRLDDHLAHDPHDPHDPHDRHHSPAYGTPDTGDTRGIPAESFPGPYSVLVVDGDPGGADVREAVQRLALEGPAAGIHVLCLAETDPASLASPPAETYAAACAVSGTFRACGAVALLGGDVATALHLMRVAHGAPVGPGTVAAVDAVSPAWAERFARALAPLCTDAAQEEPYAPASAPLPSSARLLDELGLARATPASLMARWADAADDTGSPGGRARAVLGAGPRGPLGVDLVADGPHLLIEGPPGSGRTELLRAVVASLASAERPDRLGIVLVDGRDGRDGTGASGGPGGLHGPHTSHGPQGVHGTHGTPGSTGPADGLHVCTEVPHVTTHLAAHDPVRMREFAQSLTAELKRRAELLGRADFAEWHTRTAPAPGHGPGHGTDHGTGLSGRVVPQRTVGGRAASATGPATTAADGDLESPPSTTLRLRPPSAARGTEVAPPLPRLVVVVDDLDALVSPALGSPGRPAAGSVLRALDAVAREGERLGVHLVVATGPGGRTADTEPVRRATLRVTLDAPPAHRAAAGPRGQEAGGEPAPGRGRLAFPDGRVTAFQGGRVTGRIPRTATLRPTVVPLEWQRMGDPPARRQVRELGNGPTDLALLASALERAARSVTAAEVPSLL